MLTTVCLARSHLTCVAKGGCGCGCKSGGGAKQAPKTKEECAARIQSAEARQHGGQVAKGSVAAKAQSAAAKNLAVSLIQSAEARQHGGQVAKGSFAACVQSAAAKNGWDE